MAGFFLPDNCLIPLYLNNSRAINTLHTKPA